MHNFRYIFDLTCLDLSGKASWIGCKSTGTFYLMSALVFMHSWLGNHFDQWNRKEKLGRLRWRRRGPFDRVWLPTVPSEDDQVAESLILRQEMEGAINRSKPEFKMLSLLGNAGVLHCREELGLGNGCKDSRGWRRACDAGGNFVGSRF